MRLEEDPQMEERRTHLQREITLWVGNQRLDQALKREELAQLEGIERHLALSKSLIPNIIRLCRREPRADTRAAVLILITLLSDNNNGICVLTIKRMAELLNRSEVAVRQAINALEEGGEISTCRTTGGLPNTYWPNVPAAIVATRPSVVWFVKALSNAPVRGKPTLIHPKAEHDPKAELGVSPPKAELGVTPKQRTTVYLLRSIHRKYRTGQDRAPSRVILLLLPLGAPTAPTSPLGPMITRPPALTLHPMGTMLPMGPLPPMALMPPMAMGCLRRGIDPQAGSLQMGPPPPSPRPRCG